MALASGMRLGSYEITELIGAGGMGEVYRAVDTALKRDVAIKVLPESFASDTDRMARFRQEAEVLASFNHINIAQIYGLEQSDDIVALVMELIDGPTLADRIALGPIPVDEALAIATQIAEAIETAHDNGIVHRDLKPANVKLREDGVVKVLDFGIAKIVEPAMASSGRGSPVMTTPALTQMGVILGTASYMSPEQARGKALDKRTDIWAFGAVLYEMLTGQPPFLGEDVAETVAAVLKTEPDWFALPQLPPLVTMFLKQCLEKDPKNRLHDIGDMRLALGGQYDAAAAISSAEAGSASDSAASRAAWIVAAVAGLAAVTSGIAYWYTADAFREANLRIGESQAAISDLETQLGQPLLTHLQLTYRHGVVGGARFMSDDQEIIFGAAFDDAPYQIFRTRRDSFQPRLMTEAPAADLLSVSSSNELALSAGRPPANGWWPLGPLWQMDLYGGEARRTDSGSIISFDYGRDGGPPAIVRRVGGQAVLEFPIGTEIHRGFHIGSVRVSPDGRRVCFTAGLYNQLWTAELGAEPDLLLNRLNRSSSCAWSPNGVEILFNAGPRIGATYSNIEAIRPDGQGRRILGAYTSSVRIHDVAADGAILLSAGPLRFSALAARGAEEQARDLSVFDTSRATSINGAGTHLVIYDNSIGTGGETLFVRPIDGSNYRQLSNAAALALSNDASTVAVRGDGVSFGPTPDKIRLISVESSDAESIQLDFELGFVNNLLGLNVWEDQLAEFSDDDRRLLFPYASKDGEPYHAFVYDIEEQRSYAVTPPGITGPVILSPDGRYVASNEADGLAVYTVDTGEREIHGDPIPGLLARWSYDENIVFFIEPDGAGAMIWERNLTTGDDRLRKEVRAADEAGVTLFDLKLARDGETYAYSVNRTLSDLFLLEGYVEPE